MIDQWSPKDPEEVIVGSINFSKLLAAGETITTCVFTAEREDGTTEDTTAMLSGTADLSASPVMRQKIQSGTNGATYLIRAKVSTSAARTLVGSALLRVIRGAN